MSKVLINGSMVTVSARIDPRFPGCDSILIDLGPLAMGIYDNAARKAFIAALIAADAELDAAEAARKIAKEAKR